MALPKPARKNNPTRPQLKVEPKPKTREEALAWMPFPGAQTRFLSSAAFECLFGGAAGPGKTECLLMEALRQIDHPRYNAIIFRRTYKQLDNADGLISRSKLWYPAYGGVYNESKYRWTFPSGAKIYFSYLENGKDLQTYQGAQFTFVGFDELTQFSRYQYIYMFSRCRADEGSGLIAYVRSTTNPGGPGHAWVKERFIDTHIHNKIKYFAQVDEVDIRVSPKHEDAKSRTFIPATHADNPKVSREYISNLKLLPRVERLRLLKGDWSVVDGDGMFRKEWFKELDTAPLGLKLVRRWDLASVKPSPKNPDPDWTAGALIGRDKMGYIYILDIIRVRETPGQVEKLIQDTAARDGKHVMVRMEQEGGASGNNVIDHYRRLVLPGHDFDGVRSTGSKEARAKPVAGMAEAGNIFVIKGAWNKAFYAEAGEFPYGNHDDQIDTLSGGYEDVIEEKSEGAAVASAEGIYG